MDVHEATKSFAVRKSLRRGQHQPFNALIFHCKISALTSHKRCELRGKHRSVKGFGRGAKQVAATSTV
jgi:predicted metal-binding transcription factor (methanogenesis marker protein 9)